MINIIIRVGFFKKKTTTVNAFKGSLEKIGHNMLKG